MSAAVLIERECASALLVKLHIAGVRLTLAGDDLRFTTRPGVRIAPYRERITAHKSSLAAELRKRAPVEATVPPDGWDGALCAGCRYERFCRVLGPRGPHCAAGPCPVWPADAKGGNQ